MAGDEYTKKMEGMKMKLNSESDFECLREREREKLRETFRERMKKGERKEEGKVREESCGYRFRKNSRKKWN